MAYLSWGVVVIFLLCTPPFLYFGFSYNPNPLDKISFAESFAAVFVTITMMGAPYNPKNISARIVFIRYAYSFKVVQVLIVKDCGNCHPSNSPTIYWKE